MAEGARRPLLCRAMNVKIAAVAAALVGLVVVVAAVVVLRLYDENVGTAQRQAEPAKASPKIVELRSQVERAVTKASGGLPWLRESPLRCVHKSGDSWSCASDGFKQIPPFDVNCDEAGCVWKVSGPGATLSGYVRLDGQ